MLFQDKEVTVRDKAGRELFVNDIIVIGMRDGNSGCIRLGQILEYVEYPQEASRPNCYLKIQWFDLTKHMRNANISRIRVFTDSNVPTSRLGTEYWHWHKFVKVVLPNG
jgi:hypothetical protein